MKRCWTYARVSTEEQTKKFGLDVQLDELRAAAHTRGYSLDQECIDDGYSGTDLERPALNRLLDAVKSGQVDVVLAYDPDRLARELAHQLILADHIEKAGVPLEFVTTKVEASPEGRMFFLMKGVFAEYERLKFLERARKGRIKKAKEGFVGGGRAPYGYRYEKKAEGEKGGRYLVNDAEAAVVRQIFSWLLEGTSARSIVLKLNALGIRPQRGTRWAKSSVLRLLKNETYIGIGYSNRHEHVVPENPKPGHEYRKNKKTGVRLRPRSEWIAIEVPAIVDPETFILAAQQLKKNSAQLVGRNIFVYPLKALLRCGCCGNAYAGCPSHGRRYYRSLGRDRLKGRVCRSGVLHADKIESFVHGVVRHVLTSTAILEEKIREHYAAVRSGRDETQTRVGDLERALHEQQIQEELLLDTYLKRQVSEDLYTRKRADIVTAMRSLESDLRVSRRRLQAGPSPDSGVVMHAVRRAFQKLDCLDDVGRQKLFRALLETVTVHGREVRIVGILPAAESVAHRPQHASHRPTGSWKDDVGQTHSYDPPTDEF